MKRCSKLFFIRKMQIKTTMIFYLIAVKMAIIRKSKNNKCWRGCGAQMTKHMKRYVASLTIKEMQIKTTMKYHLLLVRTATIKKSTKNKCRRGQGEKGMLLYWWWECKLIQPLWKIVQRFLKKLGIKPPYDTAIPLLDIYPEETKIEKDTCPIIHCSTTYNSQNKEAT